MKHLLICLLLIALCNVLNSLTPEPVNQLTQLPPYDSNYIDSVIKKPFIGHSCDSQDSGIVFKK